MGRITAGALVLAIGLASACTDSTADNYDPDLVSSGNPCYAVPEGVCLETGATNRYTGTGACSAAGASVRNITPSICDHAAPTAPCGFHPTITSFDVVQ
jgi:hypothetical protein